MADVHVRRAVQAAINRQKMVDLAYEGGTVPLVLPFSTFGGLDPYPGAVQGSGREVQARQFEHGCSHVGNDSGGAT